MPLQLLHIHARVKTMRQFQRLSRIAQAQYARVAELRQPRHDEDDATFIARCFARGHLSADSYRVVDRETPEVTRYDVWILDSDEEGLVFEANTTTRTPTAHQWQEFIAAPDLNDADGAGQRLADGLNDAARTEVEPDDAPLIIERDAAGKRWLVGFDTERDIPRSADAWDALFKAELLLLSEDFVRRHGNHFGPKSWQHVWRSKRSDAFIRDFARTQEDWEAVSPQLSETILRERFDKVHWPGVTNLSEAFVRAFAGQLKWHQLAFHSRFSEPFLREFADRLDWLGIARHQTLSEAFLEAFEHRLDLAQLDASQPRSIGFHRKHQAKLSWAGIWQQAPNVEALIEAFPERIDWPRISMRAISSEFITKHTAHLDWRALTRTLTEEQARHFAKHIDWVTLACVRKPWVEPLLRENEHRLHGDDWTAVLQEGRISLAYKNELRARRAQRRVLKG